MSDWKNLFPKENIFYETENGILYCGEAIETMSKFPENVIDAIITDPPYGTTACNWDAVIPFENMWEKLKRIRKDITPILLFGIEPFSSLLRVSNLQEYRYDWYWEKDKGTGIGFSHKQPLRKIENICVFYKKQPKYDWKGEKLKKPYKHTLPIKHNGALNMSCDKNIDENGNRQYVIYTHKTKHNLIYFPRDFNNPLHPTQKPLALMEYLIKTYTNEGDLVLDFTCGSGTTLVACERLNRKWVGIEIEKKYCEIAKQRIEEEVKIKKKKLKNKLFE